METQNVQQATKAICAMRGIKYQQKREYTPRLTDSKAMRIDHKLEEIRHKKEIESGDFEIMGVNLLEPGCALPKSTRDKLTANAKVSRYSLFSTDSSKRNSSK